MSLAEKFISDFNYLYEECISDFEDNPTMNAHRYAVCIQAYCLLEENGFNIPKLSKEAQEKILGMPNFFDTFYNYWVDKGGDKELRTSVSNHLSKFIANI